MQSEVKVKSPNIKVHFTIGAFLTALVIFLSLTYRIETGFILVMAGLTVGGVGGTIVLNRVIGVLRNGAVAYFDFQDRRQGNRLKRFEADRAKLKGQVLNFPRTHTVARLPGSVELISGIVDVTPKELSQELSPQLSQTLPKLQNIIKRETDIIFRGRKRSGKTFQAMQWLAGRGKVIVCDPKNEGYPINNWPSNCVVASSLREIEQAIEGVHQIMHKRRTTGQINASLLTLFFDELHDLRTRLGIDVLGVALEIATLGAEFNVFTSFTAHADTGKYLKIDAISLLENFTLVRTKKVGSVFYAYVDLGDGETEVDVSGGVGDSFSRGSRVVLQDSVAPHVLQLWESGERNIAEICRQVLGVSNVGGNQYSRIRGILTKYGKLGDDN